VPTVDWGLSKGVIDNYDRDSGYKPYTGKLPDNAVYQWQITKVVYVAGVESKNKKHKPSKNPQLRVSLVLVPRDKAEKKFKGYRQTKFMVIADTTPFQYVPFLDAIGVTEADFKRRTKTDEEGNVKSIGPWRNDGKTLILGQLQDNRGENADKYPKEVGWVGALDEEPETDEDEDEDEYEEDDEDEENDEEEEDEY